MLLKNMSCLQTLLFSLSLSRLLGGEELSFAITFCHDVLFLSMHRPRAMESNDHELRPLPQPIRILHSFS